MFDLDWTIVQFEEKLKKLEAANDSQGYCSNKEQGVIRAIRHQLETLRAARAICLDNSDLYSSKR